MPDSDHLFEYLLRDRVANSPTAWLGIANQLDEFTSILKGSILPSQEVMVRAAESACSILFCAVLTAKRENVELGFRSMIDQAKGRSFGARLINWVIGKADVIISDDMKVTWSSLHQHMSSTIEMMIRELEPVIVPGTIMAPAQGIDWIQRRGGLGKLHMSFMSIRREEDRIAQDARERDRQFGAQERRLQEARLAGFTTVEEHDLAQAEAAKERRHQQLMAKFGLLRGELVSRGTAICGGFPPDGTLLIAHGGIYYILDPKDEFNLLSCAASIR